MFLVIEGPDGAGKSTQVRELTNVMRKAGSQRVHSTREPTNTPLGEFIRAEHAQLSPRSRALAVAADRADHLHTTILPRLEDGDTVISDRYVPSSLVLQRIDGLSLEEIWRYNSFAPAPMLTVILAPEPNIVAARLSTRDQLTHFEERSTPAIQAALYVEAAKFLRLVGWDVLSLDPVEMSPRETAGTIFAYIEDKL